MLWCLNCLKCYCTNVSVDEARFSLTAREAPQMVRRKMKLGPEQSGFVVSTKGSYVFCKAQLQSKLSYSSLSDLYLEIYFGEVNKAHLQFPWLTLRHICLLRRCVWKKQTVRPQVPVHANVHVHNLPQHESSLWGVMFVCRGEKCQMGALDPPQIRLLLTYVSQLADWRKNIPAPSLPFLHSSPLPFLHQTTPTSQAVR